MPVRPFQKTLTAVVAAVVAAGAAVASQDQGSADRTEEIRQAVRGGRARYVLLFIGDGMSDPEITMARNYEVGAAGRLAMDTLPFTGEYTTYAVSESDPNQPDYAPDSASTATAWATGTKTSDGRISTVAGSDGVAPVATILELAQQAGYGVGSVTTADVTDATPAALSAHVNARGCQGPANMGQCGPYAKENGGPGSIAEQSVDRRMDVLLGGGRARFAQTIAGGPHAGSTVIESARLQGYDVVFDAAALQAATPGRPLLGLFHDSHMTVEWSGVRASPFPGSGPQRCVEGQRASTDEPSLADMTTKAIELLSGPEHPQGFFLQVEGASIDKQAHDQAPCEQIGETVAFDRAIGVGLAFAARNPDTLLIVTGDHAHTSQIVPAPTSRESRPRPGVLSTLITKEGVPMGVNYGTRAAGASQDHTGSQIRVAALGPQAANVLGVIDQTTIFHIISRALGLGELSEMP